jgi:hypothetical protein
MTPYRLTAADARLAYLAIAYHLSRPGSELDRTTQRPLEHGLSGVAQALETELEGDVATIELAGEQRVLLLNAMSGAINELKAYALMPSEGSRTHSAAQNFYRALDRLFPLVREDPDEAVQLAAHMLALRRRLDAAG